MPGAKKKAMKLGPLTTAGVVMPSWHVVLSDPQLDPSSPFGQPMCVQAWAGQDGHSHMSAAKAPCTIRASVIAARIGAMCFPAKLLLRFMPSHSQRHAAHCRHRHGEFLAGNQRFSGCSIPVHERVIRTRAVLSLRRPEYPLVAPNLCVFMTFGRVFRHGEVLASILRP